MSLHAGLLGAFTEALEIQQQLGCSSEEAWQVQRQLEAERMREYEMAAAESNVIPFPKKH
jgi:hypothetical protein